MKSSIAAPTPPWPAKNASPAPAAVKPQHRPGMAPGGKIGVLHKSPAMTSATASATLSALSPLDGRYAAKTDKLRPILSEAGFMHHRVKVEIAWLQALSQAGFAEIKPFSKDATALLDKMAADFTEQDAARIKAIETVTNHDVKAVEYWLKEQVKDVPELVAATEFIHFACTSEDINNTSHGMMLKAARDGVIVPALQAVIDKLREIAHTNATLPMLSRTHGQPDHARQGICQRGGAAGPRRGPHQCRGNSRQDEWRGRQLQRPPVGLSRFRLACVFQKRHRAAPGPDFQSLHHPDRAARLHGRTVRRRRPRQHDLAGPEPRHLDLCVAGLFQAAPESRRNRLVHHAAQGESDRFREFRGQPGHGQCRAEAHGGKAARLAHAARSDRFDGAAQHRRGPRLRPAGLRQLPARPE